MMRTILEKTIQFAYTLLVAAAVIGAVILLAACDSSKPWKMTLENGPDTAQKFDEHGNPSFGAATWK